jgi:hypothetical protein
VDWISEVWIANDKLEVESRLEDENSEDEAVVAAKNPAAMALRLDLPRVHDDGEARSDELLETVN